MKRLRAASLLVAVSILLHPSHALAQAPDADCVPVAGAPRGTRAPCASAPPGNVCAATRCDGINPDSCYAFAGAETECRPASCVNDVATLPTTCIGTAQCPGAVSVPCTPYACAGDACATSCTDDTQCSTGFRCQAESHACVPSTNAGSCDGDHTIVAPNGTTTNCAPYKCESATCKTSCNSIVDCVYPNECSPSHTCVPPIGAGDSTGGGRSVSATGTTEGGAAALALVAPALVLLRLRSRGRRRASTGS